MYTVNSKKNEFTLQDWDSCGTQALCESCARSLQEWCKPQGVTLLLEATLTVEVSQPYCCHCIPSGV